MSFTQDELQSLNMIVEQKLSTHRSELDQIFTQRLDLFRYEFEQRTAVLHQELMRSLTQQVAEQQSQLCDVLLQRLDSQQTQVKQVIDQELEHVQQQQQQQLETLVDNALAAQLVAIEQLMNQKDIQFPRETAPAYVAEPQNQISDALEVQTEISWEELVGFVGKALDDRLATLDRSMQAAVKNTERYLASQLQKIRDQMLREPMQSYGGSVTNVQEVFNSIEQLERIIESMQVAMTANHALLSNRLYHHQQLPLERAHSNHQTPATHSSFANGIGNQLPQPRESEQEL